MAIQFLKDFSRAFSPDLPKNLGNLDQHLDFILPKVIPFGEDLREEKFWIARRWKEVRDDEAFHEAILHIFNTGGEYLLSFDGNLVKGSWKRLGTDNTLILEISGRSELFDLRFLDSDFLILTKHGNQARKGLRKYFFLVNERAMRDRSTGRELDWLSLMEKMYNIWRENSISLLAWIMFLVTVMAILYLSFR